MAKKPHKSDPLVQTRFKDQHPSTFLKQWRVYRGMTQEELAAAVGWSVGNISQLERALQGYSDEGLAALASALKCTPGQILDVDPTDDQSIWSLYARAKPRQQQILLETAKDFVGDRSKTGTNS